jgi:hypothetical protein
VVALSASAKRVLGSPPSFDLDCHPDQDGLVLRRDARQHFAQAPTPLRDRSLSTVHRGDDRKRTPFEGLCGKVHLPRSPKIVGRLGFRQNKTAGPVVLPCAGSREVS